MSETSEVQRKRAPMGFNLQTLERFRDFIDVTVLASPSRTAITAFFLVITFFTIMLSLPISSADGQAVALHHAVFTSSSAVTVTGLTTVSTANQWSTFGQAMILLACQVGGLGTLTITSLLALAIGRKMGLRTKLIAQEDLNISRLGEVGGIVKAVAYTSFSIEALIAMLLTPRFLALGEAPHEALWHGIFYSISRSTTPDSPRTRTASCPMATTSSCSYPSALRCSSVRSASPCSIAIQRNPVPSPHAWSS